MPFGAPRTRADGVVDAGGGRVLTVTSQGSDLERARDNAYRAVDVLARRMGAGVALSYRSDIASNVR